MFKGSVPASNFVVSCLTVLCRTHFPLLFGILRIPPLVNHKGKDINSDWFADQWDERSVLGHARFHKGRMKGTDPEIGIAQTPKRFDRRLALLAKTVKTFTDSIPNKLSLAHDRMNSFGLTSTLTDDFVASYPKLSINKMYKTLNSVRVIEG